MSETNIDALNKAILESIRNAQQFNTEQKKPATNFFCFPQRPTSQLDLKQLDATIQQDLKTDPNLGIKHALNLLNQDSNNDSAQLHKLLVENLQTNSKTIFSQKAYNHFESQEWDRYHLSPSLSKFHFR